MTQPVQLRSQSRVQLISDLSLRSQNSFSEKFFTRFSVVSECFSRGMIAGYRQVFSCSCVIQHQFSRQPCSSPFHLKYTPNWQKHSKKDKKAKADPPVKMEAVSENDGVEKRKKNAEKKSKKKVRSERNSSRKDFRKGKKRRRR